MASTKKKQPQATGLRSRKVQGFAALLVVAAVASGAVAWSLSGSDSKSSAPDPQPTPTLTAGDKYQAEVIKDFAGMSSTLVSYLQTVQNWGKDKVDDQQMAAAAQSMLNAIGDTQQVLSVRTSFDQAPRAVIDYRFAADGYAQAAALAKATTAVPHGALRTQLQLAVNRVQTLSDRVFDQAQAELKPYMTPEQDTPGVVMRRTPEIPNWAAGSYAPATPLTDVKGDKTQREYQDTRPEQSFTAWAKLVHGAGLPSAKEEAGAISDGTLPALRTQAVDFTKVSDLLYAKPDPRGERLINTRLQLALLLDAEATQVGQAAALATSSDRDALLTVAKSLAVLGDRLWDPRLGARDTGFPAALLQPVVSTPTPS
ncbi:MAG TPA: hypothetical protein VE081_08555 [Sporichthyaceae bacterium]|nr:hypothetical protein [Sporichthyaceae bacterium]